MERERAKLTANAERFRARMEALGEDCGNSSTQIVPLIMGDEESALDAAQSLKEWDLLAIAIRPPTVPPGASRLRFAFSACHAEGDIDRLADALTEIRSAA
jgi:8-amino-7-oxononanoate synthase